MTPLKGEPDRYVNHPKNMFFIPFAVRISNSLDKKFPNTLRLLSIGKFEERKNHILLIRAFKKLLESGVKSELVLIGEVSNGTHEYHYKECVAYIEKESLSQNIKIYKNIENQEIENFYSASDLFILPSTDEPAAISILEPLGFGVPSVCSNGNGTRFYLLENDFGRVFEDNSIESLVKELKYMTLTENLEYYNFKVSENVKNVLSKEKFYTDFKNHILDEI